MQPTSETDRARVADAASVPHFTPVPPMARPDHNWLNRWPLRSYLELGALDTAPGSARAHVGAVLREWKLSDVADDGQLIVSELITNAVLSTRATCRPDPVRMWMLGSAAGVLFLVWDATSPAPVRRVTTPDAEHGRGLNIVDALSARWGSYYAGGHLGGKVVWALARSGPAVRRIPLFPLVNEDRARSRPTVSLYILSRVKTALERPPAHRRQGIPEQPRTTIMTRPQDRAPLSPRRLEMERFAAQVGLITRTPGESVTGRWEAEWWNGPKRPVRDYATEDDLIADLHRLFGRPTPSPTTKTADER